jgi:ferritin-like protein
MEQGAVTEGYKADRKRVIDVLNQALRNTQTGLRSASTSLAECRISIRTVSRRAAIPHMWKGTDPASMIREDLVADKIAIESYSEIIRWLGENDPTSRKLLEEILKVEEEHAHDMWICSRGSRRTKFLRKAACGGVSWPPSRANFPTPGPPRACGLLLRATFVASALGAAKCA